MHSSDSSKDNVGRRLKQARQRAGLSQGELAGLLKTDQSTVSRLENGANPRAQLRKLIEAYLEKQEEPAIENIEEIISNIVRSDELKALIRRIAMEV